MLIDFSLRPPYKSLAKMGVHSENSVKANAADMNMKPSEAALQHSTDLLVKEMEEAEILQRVLLVIGVLRVMLMISLGMGMMVL